MTTHAPTSHHAPDALLPSTGPLSILLGSMSMPEVYDLTKTPVAAEWAMIAFRWPYGVRCPEPHCGSENVRLRRSCKRPNELPVRFFCRDCRKTFNVRTQYFLSHSPKHPTFWFWAIYLVAATGSDPVTPASLTRLLDVTSACAANIIKRIQDHIRETGEQEPYTGTNENAEAAICYQHRRPRRTKPHQETSPQ